MIIVNESNSNYNFDDDVRNHIFNVRDKLYKIIQELTKRGEHHDDSKLVEPEYSVYKKFTPMLQGVEYQSPEYKEIVDSPEFVDALDHHCKVNHHHPEYFTDGVDEMTLVDLIEMLCDWKAASERHQNASWEDGFKINCKRFGLSDQLTQILWNTYKEYLST